jgi:hypothetical protein
MLSMASSVQSSSVNFCLLLPTVTVQNYWILDFVHHLVFYKLENTKFQKVDLFHLHVKGETLILCAPLERTNFHNWTTHVSKTNGYIYPFSLSLSSVHVLSQFSLHIFLLSSFNKAWSHIVSLTWVSSN